MVLERVARIVVPELHNEHTPGLPQRIAVGIDALREDLVLGVGRRIHGALVGPGHQHAAGAVAGTLDVRRAGHAGARVGLPQNARGAGIEDGYVGHADGRSRDKGNEDAAGAVGDRVADLAGRDREAEARQPQRQVAVGGDVLYDEVGTVDENDIRTAGFIGHHALDGAGAAHSESVGGPAGEHRRGGQQDRENNKAEEGISAGDGREVHHAPPGGRARGRNCQAAG